MKAIVFKLKKGTVIPVRHSAWNNLDDADYIAEMINTTGGFAYAIPLDHTYKDGYLFKS